MATALPPPPFRPEALPIPMAALDRDLRVVAVNRKFEELVGHVGAGLLGRDLIELMSAASAGVERVAGAQVFHLRGQLEDRWVRVDLQAHQGAVLAILTDVSAERRAIDNLRYANHTRDELLADADVGAWRYDPEQQVYLLDATGDDDHRPQPFDQSALERVLHPDDIAANREIVERIVTEGGVAEHEVRRREQGGTWSHQHIRYRSGRRTASGKYEMYGLNQNVTALAVARDEANAAARRLQLALSAAEAATEAKSHFLASVSHEIRTPMNGIVAVLNLLKRENISVDGRHLLGEALACSEMLGQLINDVLDFSKIEAGKLDLAPQACDPVRIVQSVAGLLAPQAHEKNLVLRVIAADGMDFARLDPMRLRQCLFNVIGNAVKFTERGHVTVRVSYAGAEAGRRLRCEVEDSGVGVPEAARASLFDRFQQAEGGATRQFGGTGLGLAISRSLARMMGGDMDFTSREGKGSTFWFEVAAPAAEAPAAEAACAFADAPLSGLNVLVVDDNATNRLVGVKSLEALGARATAADSGAAAIAAADLGAYDLILMDINMPQMDGLEATRRIRALNSPSAGAPVIALTADVMSHQQANYLAAGMSGVVSKPFSPAQLLAEIVRITEAEPEAVALSA